MNVFIFIPDTLVINHTGALEGSVKTWNDSIAFYITNDMVLDDCPNSIGVCSNKIKSINSKNWIHINTGNGEITVNGLLGGNRAINCVTYDYNAFRKSDVAVFKSENYGLQFENLANAVQHTYEQKMGKNGHTLSIFLFVLIINYLLTIISIFQKVLSRLHLLVYYSATALHLQRTLDTFKWTLITLRREGKITLTIGNVLVSKVADFLIGLSLLYFVLEHKTEFIELVQNITEYIIQSLEKLLHFLMGSPVGLKLNFMFNKTLGTFFLYHIALWRAFLHASSPLLILGLHLLIVPGAFGLSFQAALVSDLITFSTVKLIIRDGIQNPTVYATLQTLTLWQSVSSTIPDVFVRIQSKSWKSIFHSIMMGSLL
ncbi:hypothetical protein FQA39_LY08230 [Lamprigera yunnana]|nr:hypothetical protein FQA39_LY08230 [Lamprigera yunnana]